MADRDGNSFLWFLAGLGVGAAVGVLYAPRSGDETREVLRSKAEEGREKVRREARRQSYDRQGCVGATSDGKYRGADAVEIFGSMYPAVRVDDTFGRIGIYPRRTDQMIDARKVIGIHGDIVIEP